MSLLRGADDLAQFIARNYSGRVVEVGAGYAAEVALGLQARGLDGVGLKIEHSRAIKLIYPL
ncbi:MAG TPA: UPF0146 family protein [Methanothrix sp.]|nr:UPF0146 family protein [Methanothrix sp.]